MKYSEFHFIMGPFFAQATVKKDKGETGTYPIFHSKDTVSGEVSTVYL